MLLFFNIMDAGLTVLGDSVAVVIMPRATVEESGFDFREGQGSFNFATMSKLSPGPIQALLKLMRGIVRSVLPGAGS